ncbi:MAG: response regulator, partial [Acidiferrobacter sp.]
MTPLDTTILVVDDHIPNLAFLTDALSAAGYRVLVAVDGQEALDRLAVTRPDLILLDALMPILDGFETCRRLKATPAYESIPVIFMTALGEPEQIVQGLGLGAVDYITKPAHPEVVKARIASHVNASRSSALAREALLQSGQLPIAVDANGDLISGTTEARRWLHDYGVTCQDLASWLAALAEPGPRSAPLVRRHEDRALYINLLGRSGQAVLLLLREEDPRRARQALARDFALSSREAEVLVWV